jgi:hypothetical protein
VLARWQEHATFRHSVENRPAGQNGSNEYVFFDGPPFANGLPHYGHLLTGFVKDVVPRYHTMRGRRVERRFGWDCHGLPAEMEAEKELKISGREQITAFGIDKYNDACRKSVQRYTKEWRSYVTRQARWVDFDNDYKTMDLSYMESVMWAFKTLHQKGLVYEGQPRDAVLVGDADAGQQLRDAHRRRDAAAPGPRDHRRVHAASTGPATRAGCRCWCGRRRRGRCRATSRSRSVPRSTTRSCTRAACAT